MFHDDLCAGWPNKPKWLNFAASPTQGQSGATSPAVSRTTKSNAPSVFGLRQASGMKSSSAPSSALQFETVVV